MVISGVLLALPSWLPSAFALGTGGQAATVLVALIIYVPYTPINKKLDILIDAFLIEHDPKRSPSIVYWSNVTPATMSNPHPSPYTHPKPHHHLTLILIRALSLTLTLARSSSLSLYGRCSLSSG